MAFMHQNFKGSFFSLLVLVEGHSSFFLVSHPLPITHLLSVMELYRLGSLYIKKQISFELILLLTCCPASHPPFRAICEKTDGYLPSPFPHFSPIYP